MLTLLSPAALWSLAALALPLALHLWRQPPRTVLLPSLRFLQAHAGRRLHDLRWRERLLLLVRLCLLALLACLLARPQWQHPSRGPQRWVLLDPTAAPNSSALARLRTLQAAGYATHLLAPGLAVTSQLPADPHAPAPDLWSLLREADAMLPAGSTLAIFSPNRLASLRGLRPALRAGTEWVKTSDLAGNALHVWVATVRPNTNPAQPPAVTVGVSDAAAVRFTASPPAGWKLETRSDAARLLSPTGDPAPWTTAPTPAPLSVLILHDAARTEDARYLAAAIRAAVLSADRPLDLHEADTAADSSTLPAADWTFWLSADQPPAPIENRHTSLLEDAPHPDTARPDWVAPQPGTPGTAALAPGIRLWRRGVPPEGSVLWTDAHGSPLLTFHQSAAGPRWHFASRFDPAWSDLPRTTAFPAWLQSLLLGDSPATGQCDFRLADAAQAQPSDVPQTSAATILSPPYVSGKSLHWPVWVLAAFLFCLERFLSHRRRPAKTSPTPTFQPVPVPAR